MRQQFDFSELMGEEKIKNFRLGNKSVKELNRMVRADDIRLRYC